MAGNLRAENEQRASSSIVSSPNDGVERINQSSSTLMSMDEIDMAKPLTTRNLKLVNQRKHGYFEKVIKIAR